MRGTSVDPHEPDTSESDREAVASDLLSVLHSIPIQSIATNGPSLVCHITINTKFLFYRFTQVHKVRFVASTLLDAVRKADTAPASAARAHAYLCRLPDFIRGAASSYFIRGLPFYSIGNRAQLPVSHVSCVRVVHHD
jgi:hypothetical protein